MTNEQEYLRKEDELNEYERAKILLALKYRWSLNARKEQYPDPDGKWTYWLYLAGRGTGKTRSGAETVRAWAESGKYQRIHLIAPTAGDVRRTMVEGESGILSVCPPWCRPTWSPANAELRWPEREDGKQPTVAYVFTAERPDRLRGPQCQALWADEVCSWQYPETWDMAMMGLRLGPEPKAVITSTPRPIKLLKEIMELPNLLISEGTTYDNQDNLASSFFTAIIKKYEGTRLGRQELLGQILTDNPAALFKRAWFDDFRRTRPGQQDRVYIAVDPAISSREDSDSVGIVAGSRSYASEPSEFFLLEDATVHAMTPAEWGAEVVKCYRRHKADKVIAEANNGGEMVEATIHNIDASVPVQLVYASRGKAIRAEPISTLAQKGRIHHVGFFANLEDECCEWDPSLKNTPSPNRLDAYVWLFTALADIGSGGEFDV